MRTLTRFFRLNIIALVALFLVPLLSAEEIWHEEAGWGANIPETWALMPPASTQKSINFSDSRGHAILQVFDLDSGAAAFGASLVQKMGGTEAEAGTSDFSFSGRKARLADMRWKSGGVAVRGYILSVEAPTRTNSSASGRAYVVVAYAFEEEWKGYHNYLLSAIDSFFMGKDERYLPGAISQLIANDGWFGGPVTNQKAAVDAAQTVAEREAWVLSQYTKAREDVQKKAWKRFYQIIYRDNYHRLDDVTEAITKAFTTDKVPREKIPVDLLAWIQSFKFEEYKDIADLRVPVDAVAQKLGDCDSRGLIYMILLDRLGFDSVLMISPVYQHGMVGVGITAPGFYFTSEGRNWLVAETTVTVPIGQIRSDMNDPKNWMAFDLRFNP